MHGFKTSFRTCGLGETATHYYITRLDSIFTFEAMQELGIAHYCALPLIQIATEV